MDVLAGTQSTTREAQLQRKMAKTCGDYLLWAAYLERDKMPSWNALHKEDKRRAGGAQGPSVAGRGIGPPPESLLPYALDAMSNYDALRKEVHALEAAKLLDDSDSEVTLPLLQWEVVLLDESEVEQLETEDW